jgi:hypothetical protein
VVQIQYAAHQRDVVGDQRGAPRVAGRDGPDQAGLAASRDDGLTRPKRAWKLIDAMLMRQLRACGSAPGRDFAATLLACRGPAAGRGRGVPGRMLAAAGR